MNNYYTEYGGRFDTYEEAVDACLCDQDVDDFETYFSYQVSYTQLLKWAIKQENFFNDFYDEIDKANLEYLNNVITEEYEDD